MLHNCAKQMHVFSVLLLGCCPGTHTLLWLKDLQDESSASACHQRWPTSHKYASESTTVPISTQHLRTLHNNIPVPFRSFIPGEKVCEAACCFRLPSLVQAVLAFVVISPTRYTVITQGFPVEFQWFQWSRDWWWCLKGWQASSCWITPLVHHWHQWSLGWQWFG